MTREVRVVPYDNNWPNLFQQEVTRISNVLWREIVSVHHIGSTSIPGMSAKPIIDILLEVKDISEIDNYNNEMIALGYEPRGELGIPGRRYFSREELKDVRTHHVHTYQTDNIELERHLAFRDYMITHPDDVQVYSELKMVLARRFQWYIDGYISGKHLYMERMEKVAIEWYRSRDSYVNS
ncbi:MAG: GrpB family protein [Candidatus Thorarchaeota archaeon]|nr:MAG: GrpB family protein [Candidatus Thorarchaeota archaeon]